MSEVKFNRENTRKNIVFGIGLSPDISDEELEKHFVSIGSFFSDDEIQINALQYVNEQLKNEEQFYNEFYSSLKSESIERSQYKEIDETDILSQLNVLNEYQIDNSIPVEDFANMTNPYGKPFLPVPEVYNLDFQYFIVVVDDKEFVVAISDTKERKVLDQIKHVRSTSYFIEDKKVEELQPTDFIISYYQFVNMIEKSISKKNAEIRSKIEENVKTQFSSLDTIVNPFSDD